MIRTRRRRRIPRAWDAATAPAVDTTRLHDARPPAGTGAAQSTRRTAGSNAVHLQVAADAHSGRAVVVAALDNLVKGAAGQAIQNANLMLGLPEHAGLTSAGVAP